MQVAKETIYGFWIHKARIEGRGLEDEFVTWNIDSKLVESGLSERRGGWLFD